MSTEVIPLFSSPLYVSVDGEMPDVGKELQEIECVESGTGGFLSQETNVLDVLPQELSDWAYRHVREYVNGVMGVSSDHNLQIPNSWISVLHKGQSAGSHDHTNSMYSAVMFLSAPEGSAELVFDANRYKMLEPTIANYNLYNSSVYRISPKTGMICLFPSDMVHYVTEHQLDEPRVSLSFNIFVRGKFGVQTKLLTL